MRDWCNMRCHKFIFLDRIAFIRVYLINKYLIFICRAFMFDFQVPWEPTPLNDIFKYTLSRKKSQKIFVTAPGEKK